MSTYQYIAVDKSGKKKRGTVEADNPKNARTKIKELGLIPSEIKEGAAKTTGGKSEESSFSFKSFLEPRMSNANLCLITRQISTLVSSSMPLEETLRAVSQQCENPKHAAIINAVRDKVCEGLTLADSMKKFPRVFDDLYVSMVAAGEKSGHLDDVLERLFAVIVKPLDRELVDLLAAAEHLNALLAEIFHLRQLVDRVNAFARREVDVLLLVAHALDVLLERHHLLFR